MSTSPRAMQAITAEIVAIDPKFELVISGSTLCDLDSKKSKNNHVAALSKSIISQQLAVKAADSIYQRFQSLCGGDVNLESIADLSQGQLREIGLSGAKAKAIIGLHQSHNSGLIDLHNLHKIHDDTLLSQQLTSLWGIGPWTVHMFMMFQLGRLDVWPVGDLGVRRGWEKIHRMRDEVDPTKLLKLGEKFAPYRSVVAWYCWRALDQK
jgi:DNA-3-methyladenine glycosylase II